MAPAFKKRASLQGFADDSVDFREVDESVKLFRSRSRSQGKNVSRRTYGAGEPESAWLAEDSDR